MNIPVTKNRMEEGGDRWVIGDGGTLELEDGCKIEQNAPTMAQGTVEGLVVQHFQVAPDAVSTTAVHAAVTLDATDPTEVTTAITSPDVPRNVTVKGNQAGVTGDVVITGTNILDVAITETIALNGATEVAGSSAFKTVTQIDLPARAGEGDTVSVGIGKKIGMPHIITYATLALVKLLDGSADTGTLTVDDDEIEKNVFAINGTPNGTKLLDIYYLL